MGIRASIKQHSTIVQFDFHCSVPCWRPAILVLTICIRFWFLKIQRWRPKTSTYCITCMLVFQAAQISRSGLQPSGLRCPEMVYLDFWEKTGDMTWWSPQAIYHLVGSSGSWHNVFLENLFFSGTLQEKTMQSTHRNKACFTLAFHCRLRAPTLSIAWVWHCICYLLCK